MLTKVFLSLIVLASFSGHAKNTSAFTCNDNVDSNSVRHRKYLKTGDLMVLTENNMQNFVLKFSYDTEYNMSKIWVCKLDNEVIKGLEKTVKELVKALGPEKAAEMISANIKIASAALPEAPTRVKNVLHEYVSSNYEDNSRSVETLANMISKKNFEISDLVKISIMSEYSQPSMDIYYYQ